MKKEYTTPSIGIWQMTACSHLAVSEPFAGDWGSEGGEAGAKGSLFDVAE